MRARCRARRCVDDRRVVSLRPQRRLSGEPVHFVIVAGLCSVARQLARVWLLHAAFSKQASVGIDASHIRFQPEGPSDQGGCNV